MAKRINNPHGKEGGEKHKNVRDEVFAKLENEYGAVNPEVIVKKEVPIQTTGGNKDFRIADIAAYLIRYANNLRTTVWLRIVQIGKSDAKGLPVAREQEAMADIEAATGVPVEFYDYETGKKTK